MKKRLADFYSGEVFKNFNKHDEEFDRWVVVDTEKTKVRQSPYTNQVFAVNLETFESEFFDDSLIRTVYDIDCYKLKPADYEDDEDDEYDDEDEIELPFGKDFEGEVSAKTKKAIRIDSLDDVPEDVRDEVADALRDLLGENDEDEKIETIFAALIMTAVDSGYEVNLALGYGMDDKLMMNARFGKGE